MQIDDVGPMPDRDIEDIRCRHGLSIAHECDACIRAVAPQVRAFNGRAHDFWAAQRARYERREG